MRLAEALTTTYGIIGIKVWIYKGDIMSHDPMAQDKMMQDQQPEQPSRIRLCKDYCQRELTVNIKGNDDVKSEKTLNIRKAFKGRIQR